MIDAVTLRLLRLPLKVPYKLAFGPVTHFDTILAEVATDGGTGLGEATILTGYTEETIAESWNKAQATAGGLCGLDTESAKTVIARELREAPFTATALTTAIEMAEGHPILQIETPEAVPLIAGINATDRDGIAAEIDQAVAAGFDTLKIKAGFNVESDLERVAFIQRQNAGRARLRIDANQGFDQQDGCRFASGLDPRDIELLEQPCHADDWEGLEAVAKVSRVPLMLDESIYSEAEIERAAQIGASFVKLKLMKCVSLDRLVKELILIRDLGMEPVLGNGVASDIGCWMEACVARKYIRNAGEMNGFLRPVISLAWPPLCVESGALRLDPSGAPRLDGKALEKVTLETARFDKPVRRAGAAQ